MSQPARFTVDSDVIPGFTACYLRTEGDECAFIEAHTAHALPRLLRTLAEQGKKPEQVRWIIVTHAHLDHAAGASALASACPNATVVTHPRAARHLVNPEKLVEGATAVYGKDRFAQLYGSVPPIAPERVRGLEDGESIELGGSKLTAWHTYGHAYHHLIVDDPGTGTVYTGDTYGVIYPALQKQGRFALPSTSPTGFNAEAARTSIDKVLSLGERFVCPTHYDAYENEPRIAEQLRRFVAKAEKWVVDGAASSASVSELQKELEKKWWDAIAEEAPHFGAAERKLLEMDVELNAQGLAFVAGELRKG